jgi:hypothetical protein
MKNLMETIDRLASNYEITELNESKKKLWDRQGTKKIFT